MKLTMLMVNGFFIVGEAQAVPGAKTRMLSKPRVLAVISEKDTNGKLLQKIQLSPLPGLPGSLSYIEPVVTYAIPEREKGLYDLYARVTAPGVDPNEGGDDRGDTPISGSI